MNVNEDKAKSSKSKEKKANAE